MDLICEKVDEIKKVLDDKLEKLDVHIGMYLPICPNILDVHMGNTLNKYRVERIIGVGGFRSVYEVSNVLDRNLRYALKIIKLKDNNRITSTLLDPYREIKVLQCLDQEGPRDAGLFFAMPLTLNEHFVQNDHLCIPYPLVGCNLLDCRKHDNFSYFPAAAMQAITLQTLRAVSYIHERGITHTDIKLDNIVFTDLGVWHCLNKFNNCFRDVYRKPQIKLIDLDLARYAYEDKKISISTLTYRAPEVIIQRRYEMVSDVWSLGYCLLRLWTGCDPFKETNELDQIKRYAIVLGDVPPLMLPNYDRIIKSDKRVVAELTKNEESIRHDEESGHLRKLVKYVGADKSENYSMTVLLYRMLQWDPAVRITATNALRELDQCETIENMKPLFAYRAPNQNETPSGVSL